MHKGKRVWYYGAVILGLVLLLIAVALQVPRAHAMLNAELLAGGVKSEMPIPPAGSRVLIFAPHEDDESLGASGYIQQCLAAGDSVTVAFMTNGEYPELSVLLFEETLRRRPAEFIRLGYMRQDEARAALRRLGVSDSNAVFFGYPNQYLNQMWSPTHWLPVNPVSSVRTRTTRSPFTNAFTPNAIFCGASCLDDVEKVLQRVQPDVVVTLHPADIHVDHWPTYTFVRYGLDELAARGVPFAKRCAVFTYLIHRDNWPVPRKYRPEHVLLPPAPLVIAGGTEWQGLMLTSAQETAKRSAVAMYHTQGGGFDPLLLSFIRINELYGVITPINWPSTPNVPEHLLSTDPPADLAASRGVKGGDVLQVFLARQNGRMLARVVTRAAPTKDIQFHLDIHAGSGAVAERKVMEYVWQDGKTSGTVMADGALHNIDPAQVTVTTKDTNTTLTGPWPLPARTRFFTVRVWTMRDNAVIDETTTVPVHIGSE